MFCRKRFGIDISVEISYNVENSEAQKIMLRNFNGISPTVDKTAFIADNADVIGDCIVGEHSSVWFNAVLRGDFGQIKLGRYANVQENCTLHVDPDAACVIGDYVSIGHNAVVHGATVERCSLIGMNATILNGAVIGEGSIIGAGALVTERTIIPPHSLAVGVPARVIRTLPDAVAGEQKAHAEHYAKTAAMYKADKPRA